MVYCSSLYMPSKLPISHVDTTHVKVPMTKLLYQDDTYLFKTEATLLSVIEDRRMVVLDRTIFYPQGGGQPSDTGIVVCQESGVRLKIIMVRMNSESNNVEHQFEAIGEGAKPIAGELVHLEIDAPKRILHARIHSGGHLLDHALQLLNISMEGVKGYHFPAGPYVEYIPRRDVDLSPKGLERLKKLMEEKCQQMILERRAIGVINKRPDEIGDDLRSMLPEKALKSASVRLIVFQDTPIPGPCGGTHVANTFEIGPFAIRKMTLKNNLLRVGYLLK